TGPAPITRIADERIGQIDDASGSTAARPPGASYLHMGVSTRAYVKAIVWPGAESEGLSRLPDAYVERLGRRFRSVALVTREDVNTGGKTWLDFPIRLTGREGEFTLHTRARINGEQTVVIYAVYPTDDPQDRDAANRLLDSQSRRAIYSATATAPAPDATA